jgi:hypothetical protein
MGEAAVVPEIPIGKPDPSHFKTLVGEKITLTSADCGNSDAAADWVDTWLSNEALQGTLNSNDLNNIGCAYIWLSEPDYSMAKIVFNKALKKATDEKSKKIIQGNLQLLP